MLKRGSNSLFVFCTFTSTLCRNGALIIEEGKVDKAGGGSTLEFGAQATGFGPYQETGIAHKCPISRGDCSMAQIPPPPAAG